MEFVRLFDSRRITSSFLGDDMQKYRLLLPFQKPKSPGQQRDIMAVDRAVVAQTEFFEDNARHKEMFHAFLDLRRKLLNELAADHFHELTRLCVQMGVGVARLNPVKIVGDSADILRDRPFVIVQNNDETFGMVGDIVECFVTNTAGESGVASYHNDVLFASAPVASDRHAQAGRQGRTGMAGTVAVMLAFRAEKETVQALVLADGRKAIATPSQELMDIALMADIEQDLVRGGIEDSVQRDREFNHTQIWT